MAVRNDLFLRADQFRLQRNVPRRFFFFADQHFRCAVTVVRMDMVAVFTAGQFMGGLEAGISVQVSVAFLQITPEFRCPGKATVAVLMAGTFFRIADQLTAFVQTGLAVLMTVVFFRAAD